MQAVLWSFIGLRKNSEGQEDMAKLNPVHVVIAGVLGAALFVLMLVLCKKVARQKQSYDAKTCFFGFDFLELFGKESEATYRSK